MRSNSTCQGRMSIHVSEVGTLGHASGRALNLRGWPLSISEDYKARLLVDPSNRRSERGLKHSVTELESWNANREQEKSTAYSFPHRTCMVVPSTKIHQPHRHKVIPATRPASQQWGTAQDFLPCSDLLKKISGNLTS